LFCFLSAEPAPLDELYQRWNRLPASFEVQIGKNCLLQRKNARRVTVAASSASVAHQSLASNH
jgi:hypothetical protein